MFLISLLINPFTYIICFVLLGWLVRTKRWKRLCFIWAALLFLLFSNGSLYQWAAEQWYREYDHALPKGKQYTYGIVLGGYSYWDWKRDRPEFSGIADRLLEGIRLYKQGRIRKLVLASDGSIIESKDGKGDCKGILRTCNNIWSIWVCLWRMSSLKLMRTTRGRMRHSRWNGLARV